MTGFRFVRNVLAVLALLAVVLQGTLVLAGTTGALSGTLVDASSNSPIAGARVSAASPSQSAVSTTDANGRFTFLTLAPDTYTITAEKSGYDTASTSGITVTADQTLSLSLSAPKSLRTIGRTTSRATSDVVKPGVTTDVYAVNAATAEKAQGLGGGGSLNQAYAAIASVPGVYIPLGSSGWNQSIIVRGSNYDQTGYEYDGIPVTRAFDNYAAHTAPLIGSSEIQVYTGGGPASAAATGLGGFINQVIRTGTYPSFTNVKLATAGPGLYTAGTVENGGASPDRNFSYYGGFTWSNQTFRYLDQFNGASSPLYQTPLSTPGFNGAGFDGVAPACVNGAPPASVVFPAGIANNPGCYAMGGGALEYPARVKDAEFVFNTHYAIPHRNGDGKDDVQFLYQVSRLHTEYADSFNEIAALLAAANGAGSTPKYKDGAQFPGGTVFGQSAVGLACIPYQFPSSPAHNSLASACGTAASALPIDPTRRDSFDNDAAIFKLQYTKNLSDTSYLRLTGYTFYSDWLNNGAVSRGSGTVTGIVNVNVSPDYELDTHTRGIEFRYVNQFNAANLLELSANLTQASTMRFNNTTMSNSTSTAATNLVDAAGNCYGPTGAIDLCNGSVWTTGKGVTFSRGSFGTPTPFAATGAALAAGAKWIVTNPGLSGSFNTVAPKFSTIALTDTYRPTDKININLGVKFERFEYDLQSTSDPGQAFWAAAIVKEACYSPTSLAFSKMALVCPAGTVHPDGTGGSVLYNNNYPLTYAPTVLEPRVSGTYKLSNDTVLRAAYGRNAEPPNTAAVDYARAEPNTPAFFFKRFSPVGYFSPFHPIRPAVASNYDVGLERHIRGTDMSFSVTPFLKTVQDNLQDVYLDQATQFVSSINAGRVRTSGVEVSLKKGDFNRDGFAGSIGYTYTKALIQYQNLGNTAVNAIDQINTSISGFNAFTKAGGGAPCYTTAGAALATCTGNPTAIQNPYYNIASQPLLDRNGWYTPFTFTPAVQGAAQSSFYAPHVVTAVLNYKKGPLAITPTIQLVAGQPYGAPLNQLGWDPTTCTQNQNTAGIASAAAAGRGQFADWTSCGGSINIPNYETGTFDTMGTYTQPSELVGNLQISYEFNKQVGITLLAANLINNCFGGTQAPWTVGGSGVCGYGLDGYLGTTGISNFYNGASPQDVAANGVAALPYNLHAYTVQGIRNPVQLIMQVRVKL